MSIYSMLYDWQQNLVNKFFDRKRFGIFLDMGLGKTPTSLGLAEQHECEKVIVVTINPKATETIENEGSWHWWASKSSQCWEICPKGSNNFEKDKRQIFITNYESLFKRGKSKTARMTLADNVQNFVSSCRGKNVAIIIDESHKVKNLQSQQTLAIQKIQLLLEKNSTCWTYLLTGTPFTTGYIDLYSQLKLLGYADNKNMFVDQFCIRGNIPGLLGYQQPIIGYKNVHTLFNLIHRFAITIDSDDVVKLPETVFINHVTKQSLDFSMYIDEFVPQSKLLMYAKKRGVDILPEKTGDVKVGNMFYRNVAYPDLKWLAETSGQFWLRARELSIGFQGNAEEAVWYDESRLQQLKEFLANNEENYVLFYNFVPELLKIFDICEELGYNIDVYCGEVKSLTHYERYSAMSEEERLVTHKNVIISNFASGATGMNWQLYNHCIIFSTPLYSHYAQAIKRVHRIGQKKTVFYHVFYQNNWLDGSMRKALEEKKDYNHNMFDSDLARVNVIMKGETL